MTVKNAVIEKLETERANVLQTVDGMLECVDGADRDLVPAERDNLTALKERVTQIDEQLKPLYELENLRSASKAGAPSFRPSGGAQTESRSLGANAEPYQYRSMGEFAADVVRAAGFNGHGDRCAPDENAAARLNRAVAHQVTGDTPGLLPVPIIPGVIDTLDAARPFISSVGVRALGNIPGAKFLRPKITQHALSGAQTAEKTELPSRKVKIESLEFLKTTRGTVLNVSRQEIDWTSPAAWDIILRDMANAYAVDTETVTATAFNAGVTQTVAIGTAPTQANWIKGLYDAAVLSYKGGGRLPDRLWVSLDVWAEMGALVDEKRPVLLPDSGNVGTSTIRRFAGIVLDTPRIVVPSLPDGTAILGSSEYFEVYEERVGPLQAVQPSLFGVEVSLGGYIASGFTEAKAFAKLVKEAPAPPEEPEALSAKSGSK